MYIHICIHIYTYIPPPPPPFGTTRFLVELWYTVPQTDLNMFLGPPVVGINIWGIVKIMVPVWVPIIIRGLIRGLIQGTQKGTIFDNPPSKVGKLVVQIGKSPDLASFQVLELPKPRCFRFRV